jgi:hypothetical protein
MLVRDGMDGHQAREQRGKEQEMSGSDPFHAKESSQNKVAKFV